MISYPLNNNSISNLVASFRPCQLPALQMSGQEPVISDFTELFEARRAKGPWLSVQDSGWFRPGRAELDLGHGAIDVRGLFVGVIVMRLSCENRFSMVGQNRPLRHVTPTMTTNIPRL